MSSIFSDGALHPGRDPNDSSWQLVRTAHDWADARFAETLFDSERGIVELEPRMYAPWPDGNACLTDERFRYVADRPNHRVLVYSREDSALVIALEPITDPVAIAIDRDHVYVADGAVARVHLYSRGFRWLRVLDFDDPMLPDDLGIAGVMRFARSGDVIVGPIDGLDENLAWHRVVVEAELPDGSRVHVQTYASDDPTAPTAWPWAPAAPVAITTHHGERPVQSDVGRWARARRGEYVRARPVLATFAGDGPNGVGVITLAADALARVRAGDTLTLTTGTVAEPVDIAGIPERHVSVAVRGTVAAFTLADVVLHQRDGVEPFAGPRTIYTLTGAETIDLSAVPTDGTIATITLPHQIAALWRRGDVITVDTATVLVDDVDRSSATVTLTSVPGADYSNSVLTLDITPGRLFVTDPTGFDAFLPVDEPISVSGLGASAWSKPAQIHWVEADLGAMWLAPGSGVVAKEWETLITGDGVATDRGRWLWLRLQLEGTLTHPDDSEAVGTPRIHSVRLVRPRLSYLRYLPATFARRDRDDPTGSLFLERMLAMFERRFTGIETRYESVARQLDPFAASPEWLTFVAGWFDLYLDPTLSPERRALLLAEAHSLYASRGTPAGIIRYIEIVTGETPTIVEGFQLRPNAGMVLGSNGFVGCGVLGGLDEQTATSTAMLDQYAHRWTLNAFVLDPCDLESTQAMLDVLIESVRPAHTLVTLNITTPSARVGDRSVGIDFVLGDDRTLARPLGEDGYPVLGIDAVLAPSTSGIAVDDVGIRIDGDFSLR